MWTPLPSLPSAFLSIAFLLSLSFPQLSMASEHGCCLCGLNPSDRNCNMPHNLNSMTCRLQALQLINPNRYQEGTTACRGKQDEHYSECCDPNYVPVKQPRSDNGNAGVSSDSPDDDYEEDYEDACDQYLEDNPKEPVCNICHDGSIPAHPRTVTKILYMPGNNKCIKLYWMGLKGCFPERICNPAQDYFEEPCGCPEHRVSVQAVNNHG